MELVETYIVGTDGEGLVKTLVRGGSVRSGVDVRLKRSVNCGVKVWKKVTGLTKPLCESGVLGSWLSYVAGEDVEKTRI